MILQYRQTQGISYCLDLGDDFANKFSINERSGLIETTAIPLDRETRQTYELVVSVTDSGSPTRMVNFQVYTNAFSNDFVCYRALLLSLSWF